MFLTQFGIRVDVYLMPLEVGFALGIGERLLNNVTEIAVPTRIHNYIVHLAVVMRQS